MQTREKANLFEKTADALTDMMQSVFLFLLRPFEGLCAKMKGRTKNFLISASFFCILILVYLQHTGLSDLILKLLPLPAIVRYVFFDLLGCVLVAVAAVCSIKGRLERVRCNASLVLLWTGLCVCFFLSAVYTSLDWAGLTIILTFVFPCLYFVWNNRGDYGELFRLMTRGVVAFYLVFLAGTVLFSPLSGGQYRALFTNANSLGQFLTLMVPLFLFQYGKVMQEKGWEHKLWPLLGLGSAAALIFFSASRTAIVSCVIIAGLWLVCKLVVEQWENGFKELLKNLVKRAIPMAVAVAICIPATFGVIKFGTTAVSFVMIQLGLAEGDLFNMKGTLAEQIDTIQNRVETEGKDADQLSTHRTLIWQAFASRVEPLGHERGKIYVDNYGVAGTAHNCYIQIAYDSGPAAVLFYFAINAYTGFRALWYYLRRRKTDPYALFPVLLMPGFLVTSLLASSYPPFAYGVALAYWVIQAPLFEKRIKAEKA